MIAEKRECGERLHHFISPLCIFSLGDNRVKKHFVTLLESPAIKRKPLSRTLAKYRPSIHMNQRTLGTTQ